MNHWNRIKTITGRLLSVPWYPIVFSAYPVLALLSENIGQVQASAALRPLLVTVAAASLLYLLLRLLLRDWHRAAFLSTLLMALFFSYGHAYNLLIEQFPKINLTPWTLSSGGVLAVLAVWWVTRPKAAFASSAWGFNVIALGLVIAALAGTNFGPAPKRKGALPADNAPVEPGLVKPQDPPDVYYFILDSYARQDLLQEAYGFDNSGFIQALQQRGFYVAGCGQSNYGRTELSLASSLNMSYLQGLDHEFTPDNIDRTTLWDSLKHSAARANFESLGYKIVNFANGFAWMELTDADEFLSPPPLSSGMTEFEGLYLQTTLARRLQDLGWLDPDAIMAQNYRDRFEFDFNSMNQLAADPAPTFAYIHVLAPHPPFVFGPHGEPTNPDDYWNEQRIYPSDLYAKGYTNELPYLNQRILDAVDILIKNSPTPPVIILQGDHGPWVQPNPQHFMIFNAYYLPGHTDQLYPTITPVNTFRLVFDAYFGGKYDMLKDVSYDSPVPDLFNFTTVPNPCEK